MQRTLSQSVLGQLCLRAFRGLGTVLSTGNTAARTADKLASWIYLLAQEIRQNGNRAAFGSKVKMGCQARMGAPLQPEGPGGGKGGGLRASGETEAESACRCPRMGRTPARLCAGGSRTREGAHSPGATWAHRRPAESLHLPVETGTAVDAQGPSMGRVRNTGWEPVAVRTTAAVAEGGGEGREGCR